MKRETVGEAVGDPWQIPENFFCLKAEKNFGMIFTLQRSL